MADIIAITKADGDNLKQTQQACAEYQYALHLIRPEANGWSPKVIATSAINKIGLTECWALVSTFINHIQSTGAFEQKRNSQKIGWLKDQLNATWRKQMDQQNSFGEKWNEAVMKIERNEWTVFEAVNQLTGIH